MSEAIEIIKRMCFHCHDEVDFQVAKDSSYVEARDSSHVEAGVYVSIRKGSPIARIRGGVVIGAEVMTAAEWLDRLSIKSVRGKVILYKSVGKDFITRNGVSFKPGTKHAAPDWDPACTEECGKGIHYAPSVTTARLFRDEEVYVACEVAVKDMASLPAYAEHPDKIRARGGKALYLVDKNGNRISTPH